MRSYDQCKLSWDVTTPYRQGVENHTDASTIQDKAHTADWEPSLQISKHCWGTLQAESLAALQLVNQTCRIVLPTMYTRQILWPMKSGPKSVSVNLGCLAALLAVSGRVRKILMRHAYKALRFNSQHAAGF